jgi:hypothetical protein
MSLSAIACQVSSIWSHFSLTHLREWIAPDYNWRERNPHTSEEHFFQEIFKLDEFQLLQGLCNRSKHMCVTDYERTLHKTVRCNNPTSPYTHRQLVGLIVNGNDMENVIRLVIKFYEDSWFSKSGNQEGTS